mmetsp:Transcript_12814/g.14702  ORF Transcript_12814/g.14702 Transcript_12814/m.14702 type:complete len:260 (-) Transcript_12814:927-1706(-)
MKSKRDGGKIVAKVFVVFSLFVFHSESHQVSLDRSLAETDGNQFDVLTPEVGVDLSPSAGECETKCNSYILNATQPANCSSYSSLLSEYIFCTTKCGYPRGAALEKCEKVRPDIDKFLNLDENFTNGCLACNSIEFPFLSTELEVRSECILDCKTFLQLSSIYEASSCSQFLSEVKEAKSCYKACDSVFLRNSSECTQYLNFDSECRTCEEIYPDVGAGIAIFGGMIALALVGCCFVNDLIGTRKKKQRYHDISAYRDY